MKIFFFLNLITLLLFTPPIRGEQLFLQHPCDSIPASSAPVYLPVDELKSIALDPSEGAVFLTEFLTLWYYANRDKKEQMKDFLAPSFLEKEQLNDQLYMVDKFVPAGCKVYKKEGDEYWAYVWGTGYFWAKQLKFKLVTENGKLYILPSTVKKGAFGPTVKPWQYVNKEIYTKKSKYEKKLEEAKKSEN